MNNKLGFFFDASNFKDAWIIISFVDEGISDSRLPNSFLSTIQTK